MVMVHLVHLFSLTRLARVRASQQCVAPHPCRLFLPRRTRRQFTAWCKRRLFERDENYIHMHNTQHDHYNNMHSSYSCSIKMLGGRGREKCCGRQAHWLKSNDAYQANPASLFRLRVTCGRLGSQGLSYAQWSKRRHTANIPPRRTARSWHLVGSSPHHATAGGVTISAIKFINSTAFG